MRTPRFVLPALAVLLFALLPAGASAATIGNATLSGASDLPLGPGNTAIQAADGSGQPSYSIPAGGGVITAWAARLGASSAVSATFKLKVLRPAGAQWQVVGESPGTITGANVFAPASFSDARIPVQAGDRLGLFVPLGSTAGSGSGAATGSKIDVFAGDASGTFAPGSSIADARINVQATVEPDADGDGYGDTTQDQCPQLPDRHTPPCDTDVALTATAPTAGLSAGGVATVVLSATANPGPATGAVATVVLPAGVEVLAASTTGGECTGTGTLSCAFGDIPGGGSRKAFLVLRPTKPGAQTIVSTIQSGVPDPAPANNTISTVLNVGPAAPTGAGSVALCKVPKLAGLSASAAGKRLKSAGCKLGRAGGAKGKGARVRSQAIPAGIKVAAGTKVAVTLGLPKTKAKAKRG